MSDLPPAGVPPAGVPPASVRAQLRSTRAGGWLWKTLVFVAGLFFIALGLVLVVLPGPLTIPPMLLGLYIWSTEFAWADRWRARMLAQGRIAWQAAQRRPVHTAAVTVGGIVLLIAAVIAARRYDVVDRLLGSFG
ncbi:MAG: hypothetical protein JJD92_16635 [Frankiaceae bacterium]|nr:hypothetical protein [Frankiaceae bacterium]